MKNVAVLLAGGSGKRMGGNLPKQFLLIGDKPIIQHTMNCFEHHALIDEICIVIHPDFVSKMAELVRNNAFQKVKHILTGGKERSDSSLAAIKAYSNEQLVNLIFHDAVRPFVSERIISDVVAEVQQGKSVAVAIPTTDTILKVTAENCIESVPVRSSLRRAQTPQAFPFAVIKKAYDLALNDEHFVATDDCGVVLKYLPQEKIYIVEGDESNIKITFERDLIRGNKKGEIR